MSEIKLTADSGGGTTSIKAPSSTTSNADVVLKLPVADGSANQVLKTDGSGQLSFTSNAGTTINNNADNRIITGSGTASTLNGESSLTYDGSDLNISNDVPQLILTDTNSNNSYGRVRGNGGNLILSADHGGATADSVILAEIDGSEKVRINSDGDVLIGRSTTIDASEVLGLKGPDSEHCTLGITSDGTTNLGIIAFNDDDANFRGRVQYDHNTDSMQFRTAGSERMRILSGGGLTFNGDTAAANALDDYEEGTWTPAVEGTYITSGTTTTYHSQLGTYTKIGRQVFINGYLHINAISYSTTNQTFEITGLPFNGATTGGGTAQVTGSTVWQQLEWVGAAQSSYGTNNDVVLSPSVSGYNKVRFKTCSQDKYYVGEMLNNAVDGNQALLIFSFQYLT